MVELLGEQKGERGLNRYFRCLKCGSVLILSEEGVLYEVPKGRETKTEAITNAAFASHNFGNPM